MTSGLLWIRFERVCLMRSTFDFQLFCVCLCHFVSAYDVFPMFPVHSHRFWATVFLQGLHEFAAKRILSLGGGISQQFLSKAICRQ